MTTLTSAKLPLLADPLPAVTARIVAAVRQALAQAYRTRLRAIVLTGSLARQEGSWLETPEGYRLLGDAEFLVVFKRRSLVPPAQELLNLGRRIEKDLCGQGVSCRIDLGGVGNLFFSRLPRNIFAYELMHNGRVVDGDPSVLASVPHFPVSSLDPEDAWRMLSNRLLEWLEISAEVDDRCEEPGTALVYSSVKLLLDAATSLLVLLRGYEPSYAARAESIQKLARITAEWPAPPLSLPEFAAQVARATEWKISPRLLPAGSEAWHFCLSARRLATKLWPWELSWIAGLSPTLPPLELVQRWGLEGGIKRSWRGWLRAARELGWPKSVPHWPHWLSLARRGSPRFWLYALAAECALREDVFTPRCVPLADACLVCATLRPYLPVSRTGHEAHDDWRSLVRNLAWNYHQFVERTTA